MTEYGYLYRHSDTSNYELLPDLLVEDCGRMFAHATRGARHTRVGQRLSVYLRTHNYCKAFLARVLFLLAVLFAALFNDVYALNEPQLVA